MLTLGMLGIVTTFLTSYFFPVTVGVMYALVWYIRKKTSDDKPPQTITYDEKIGSPF